jgi:hypothetical protein
MSKPNDPYLGVTAHYIKAPQEWPNEWKLESKVLGVVPIEGRHTAANMAATFLRVLDRYDIRDKVSKYCQCLVCLDLIIAVSLAGQHQTMLPSMTRRWCSLKRYLTLLLGRAHGRARHDESGKRLSHCIDASH